MSSFSSQFSRDQGLTPRPYDNFKALYTLAALDAAASSFTLRRSEIPTRSTFSDIDNDYHNVLNLRGRRVNTTSPPLTTAFSVTNTQHHHCEFLLTRVPDGTQKKKDQEMDISWATGSFFFSRYILFLLI